MSSDFSCVCGFGSFCSLEVVYILQLKTLLTILQADSSVFTVHSVYLNLTTLKPKKKKLKTRAGSHIIS